MGAPQRFERATWVHKRGDGRLVIDEPAGGFSNDPSQRTSRVYPPGREASKGTININGVDYAFDAEALPPPVLPKGVELRKADINGTEVLYQHSKNLPPRNK